MKYQNAAAFRKHLLNAAPDHLADLYFVGVSHDSERRYYMRQIFCLMGTKDTQKTPISCKETSFAVLMRQVQTKDLFSSEHITWVDDLDQLKKEQSIQLFRCLTEKAIVGAAKAISLPLDFQKRGVSLELFSEKPWDRDQRIAEEIEHQIHIRRKKVSSEVVKDLILRREKDLLSLEKEVEKLCCFAGDRSEITKEDVEKVVPITALQTHWALVDELLWHAESKGCTQRPFIDANFFYGWLSLMRAQLQLGYKISSLLEKNMPLEQIKKHFPDIWPKAFEKKKQIAQRQGSLFFQKGLEYLFEIEVLSKDGVSSYEALLDLFQTKMIDLSC